MNCSMPGSSVYHYLPEFFRFMSIKSVMLSNKHILCQPLLLCLQHSPVSGAFPMRRLFTSDDQMVGVLASATVLPTNIQGWFPLGLSGLISLHSKEFSRVFSSTTIWKHQFFSAQSHQFFSIQIQHQFFSINQSLWSNTHICTRLLEKP